MRCISFNFHHETREIPEAKISYGKESMKWCMMDFILDTYAMTGTQECYLNPTPKSVSPCIRLQSVSFGHCYCIGGKTVAYEVSIPTRQFCILAAPVLTQLLVNGLGKAMKRGPIQWKTQMNHVALTWPSADHCGQLGSEWANQTSVSPSPYCF